MNTFGARERELRLTNTATAVLVDAVMSAVSDLAAEPWDYRFAAAWALQDQNVVGRGTVGFDLADVAWGESGAERARNGRFALAVVDLAATGHRRAEPGYEPASAGAHLRALRDLVVHALAVPPAVSRTAWFPSAEEALTACCVRHRILTGLPRWEACVRCTAE